MEMSRDEIREAVLEYIELIERGMGSPEENLRALVFVLDKLALARSFIDYEFDQTDYPDAPREDYHRLCKLANERFPALGFYNSPVYIADKIAESELCVGDADDDIADLARDLHEVAWRWKNTSADDALWYFEHSYDSHLGCTSSRFAALYSGIEGRRLDSRVRPALELQMKIKAQKEATRGGARPTFSFWPAVLRA